MISRLTGTIVHNELKYVVLDVNGVGYKVYTTADMAGKLGKIDKTGKKSGEKSVQIGQITLWTHLAVRDDALDLYGFTSLEELHFFELLITISGIGPKTALGILNVASIEALDSAIRSNETTHLVKVAGLGKKMAEKIVRELHDKLADSTDISSPTYDAREGDALEALKSLGYTHNEAREALKEVDAGIKDTGAKVKAALIILGK